MSSAFPTSELIGGLENLDVAPEELQLLLSGGVGLGGSTSLSTAGGITGTQTAATGSSRRSSSPKTGFSKKPLPSQKSAHEFATQTRANALDPAQLDPKRARRIIANRQSAHKSRLKKLNQIHTLEKEVDDAQAATETLRLEANNMELFNAQLLASLEGARNMAIKLQVQVQQQVMINQMFRNEFARLTSVLRERTQQQQQHHGQQLHASCAGQGNNPIGGGRPRDMQDSVLGGCASDLPRVGDNLPDIAEEQLPSGPASMATTSNGANLLSQAASYESMQTLSTVTPPDSLPRMDALPVVSPCGSDTIMDSSPLINVPTLTFPGSDHRGGSYMQLSSSMVDPLALAYIPQSADCGSARQYNSLGLRQASGEGSLPSLMDVQSFDLGLPDLNFSHDLFMVMPALDSLVTVAASGGGPTEEAAGPGPAPHGADSELTTHELPLPLPLNLHLQSSAVSVPRSHCQVPTKVPFSGDQCQAGLGSLDMDRPASLGTYISPDSAPILLIPDAGEYLADIFSRGCLDP